MSVFTGLSTLIKLLLTQTCIEWSPQSTNSLLERTASAGLDDLHLGRPQNSCRGSGGPAQGCFAAPGLAQSQQPADGTGQRLVMVGM